MAKGYAAHVRAGERDLRQALRHLERASASNTRGDRGHHLAWAVALAEAAVQSVRQADPHYTRLHSGEGPCRQALKDNTHE